MIWLLIVINLSGNVVMQPFSTQADCQTARSWMIETTEAIKYTTNSSVKSSICMKVGNPYLR